MAKATGFERIVLKNDKFIGYFIADQESPYYQSDKFTTVLEFVKKNPKSLQFRQVNTRLSFSFANVKSVTTLSKSSQQSKFPLRLSVSVTSIALKIYTELKLYC